MNKTCEQCGLVFEFSEADKLMYQKVSPVFLGKRCDFLEPKICVECRQQNRLAYRNERTLYKRNCDCCGEGIISTYHEDVPWPVYCQDCYWSDKWNALDYGLDYDFSKSFYEQFRILMNRVPRISLVNKQSENSEYANYAFANKNCYLIFGSHYEEDCLYGSYSTKNKDCVDYFWLYGSELCYEAIFSANCYRCVFVERCEDCSDCRFCFDLKGCRDCLFSTGLRNKQYYIFNEQKTKEEYEAYLNSLKMSSYAQLKKLEEGWVNYRDTNAIFKACYQTNCQNCEGNNHQNSKNLRHCFAATGCEDCVYGYQMDETYSSVENSHTGYDRCELLYQTVGHNGSTHCMCSDSCWHSSDLIYCNLCFSSRDCFGSIGMRHNQYCVLNKQYSKEKYENLVLQIIDEMVENTEWGEFFPHFLRPYAYNESMAQYFMPLSAEEVLGKGWKWREKIDQITEKSLQRALIPDDISDVKDDVVGQVCLCEKSGRPYKIVRKELDFCRLLALPLPRLCPSERSQKRFSRVLPINLFSRKCDNCDVALKSSYAPGRKEKVYCEDCYLKEVY